MNLKLLNDQINVLMIDDDLKLQKMIAQYLNSQNLNFHSAFTAKEAINHQALDSINVVLIDIQLPDMTGFECAKIINEKCGTSASVLFLSGVSMDTDSICKGYDIGCVDYLLKPIDPQILIKKINTAYEHSQQILELEYIVEEKLAMEEELLKLDLEF